MATRANNSRLSVRLIFANVLIFFVTLVPGLIFTEIVLRVKNSDQRNYNIEMWRYSKLLKMRSADENMGFEHKSNAHARLEGVEIRLNSLGMRGPEPDLNDHKRKRILFLGSSNTLAWGVKEEETMCAVIQRDLKDSTQVFNAGIGNYNAQRYVALFEKKLRPLKPQVVVVHYFIRDAEVLEPGGGNFLLRNSEAAVTLYHLFQNLSYGNHDPSRLVAYYRKMYSPGSPGFQEMENALSRLNEMSQSDHFKVVLAIVPDIHAVKPYPFAFIHERVRMLAESYHWSFVDFSGPLLDEVPAEELWVMPGDPHMNGKGQQIMAKTLLPYLE